MANLSQRIVRAALDTEVKRLVLNKEEIKKLSEVYEISAGAKNADETDLESVEALRNMIAAASGMSVEHRARLRSALEAAEVDLGIRPAPPVKPRAKKEVAPPAPLVVDPASLATDAVS